MGRLRERRRRSRHGRVVTIRPRIPGGGSPELWCRGAMTLGMLLAAVLLAYSPRPDAWMGVAVLGIVSTRVTRGR